MPEDSTEHFIAVGDGVRFHGEEYTIKAFGPRSGACGTRTVTFEEDQKNG